MNRRSNRTRAGKAAVLAAAVFLSGCAGPSTKVLPQKQGGTYQDVPGEIPVVEEVNSFYLQESLTMLSAAPRPAGSRGEDSAARYIQRMLKDYGYQVNRQRFRERTEHETVIGTNVVAVRPADDPDADILVICSWHDGAPDSPGAGNNASGVSVFLETARILSGIPTDTEVRFVSLSAHEKDALGARIYTKSLSKREKERLTGVITIGPCGSLDCENIVLGTQDGNDTMLGDLLKSAAAQIADESWNYGTRAGMENGIFASYEIPAVEIGQEYRGFSDGTPLDTVDTVDVECLSEIVDTVCQAVSGIMSLDTPSMRAKAHFENNWKTFQYEQELHGEIPFGSSAGELQALLGIPGKLALVNRDAKNRPIEKYQFQMKWFGLEQPLTTSYYFTDDALDLVSLTPGGSSVTAEDLAAVLTGIYGDPAEHVSGPYGTDYTWKDGETGQQLELIPGRDDFEIEIRSFTPEKRLIGRFAPDGTVLESTDLEIRGLEQLKNLCQAVFAPQEGLPETDLLFETDGTGNFETAAARKQHAGEHAGTLAENGAESGKGAAKAAASGTAGAQENHAAPEEPVSDPAEWEVAVDPADFLLPDGSYRNWTNAARKLTAAYGTLLKEAFPETYLQGYETLKEKNMEEPARPDAAPGADTQAGGAEAMQLPEFEDAFALYVLTGKPQESPGRYQECIRYFYQFGELNTYRSAVRNALGLQTEE